MKKQSLALVALVVGGSAAAQSGVTVGGVADAALRHVRNDDLGSITSLASGANATSRLFVRGTEDLGAGLSAGFHLEHGILLDAGNPAQATQFWDRRATVSLASRTLGELRLGRDFVPSYVSWSRFDPFGYVGVASSSNLLSSSPPGPVKTAFGSSPSTTVRSSNAVQLLLPGDLGGLEGGVLVGLGEGGAAANGQHKVTGLRAGYVAGALNVAAGYTRTQNDQTSGTGAFTDLALGGAYDFGPARVSVALRRFAQADARQSNLLIGAWVPLGTGELRASFQRAGFSGRVAGASVGDNDARQFGIGYVHSLSKRTAVYTTLSRIDNGGAAAYTVPGGVSGLAGGATSTGVEAGLRHNF